MTAPYRPMDQRQAQQQFPTLSDQAPGGTSPMSAPQAQARAPRPQGPGGQPQGYQNFRQMQQQGQARPAPWGFTPPQAQGNVNGTAQQQAERATARPPAGGERQGMTVSYATQDRGWGQQQGQPPRDPRQEYQQQRQQEAAFREAGTTPAGMQANAQQAYAQYQGGIANAQAGGPTVAQPNVPGGAQPYQPPTVTPYSGGMGQPYTPQSYTPGAAYQPQSMSSGYTPQAMNAPQYQGFQGQAPGQVTAPGGVGGTSNQVSSLLQQMMQNPTAYDDTVIKAQRDAAMGTLDQQSRAMQSQLDEEMARRGVYASSVAGGRMGDLAANRLQAIRDLESTFLTNRADAMDRGRQAAAGLGLQSDSLNQQGALAAARMGLDAQMANSDNAFRYSNLGEQSRQFGAGLGRDYAQMGMQDRQFGAGLDRDYARMGMDDRQFGADLGMRDRQFGANLAQNDRQFGANYGLDRDRFGYDRWRDERNFTEDRFRDGRDFDWRALQDLMRNYGGAGLTEY